MRPFSLPFTVCFTRVNKCSCFCFTGLFHRKRSNRDSSKSPRGSPEPRRKALDIKDNASNKPDLLLDQPAEEIRKRRTVSDVTPMLQEKWVTTDFSVCLVCLLVQYFLGFNPNIFTNCKMVRGISLCFRTKINRIQVV